MTKYGQVMDLQQALIRRGLLLEVAHDVAEGRECANGETLIECTCGRGMFRRPEESEAAYVAHVVTELRKLVAA